MAPLFFSLGNRLQPMIIRDTDAHLNGQSHIKKTYSIFQDMALRDPRQSRSKEGTLHLEPISDLEYYGFLSLATPDSKYIYTANGLKHLSEDELEQLIEQLNA